MENTLQDAIKEVAGEQWRDVVGYEGFYQVSNNGRVKSLDRIVKSNYGNVRLYPGKLKKTPKMSNGYPCTQLFKYNVGKTFAVHKLVAKAFLPNPNNLPEVNHIDGVRYNNNVSNLEWCNRSGNMTHAVKIGRHKGFKRALTFEDAEKIRNINGNKLQKDIANEYGVSRVVIRQIISKRTYKNP